MRSSCGDAWARSQTDVGTHRLQRDEMQSRYLEMFAIILQSTVRRNRYPNALPSFSGSTVGDLKIYSSVPVLKDVFCLHLM